MLDRGADENVRNESGVTIEAALANRKILAERLREKLPAG